MKALVLYDSNYGNTKKLAEIIAESLDTYPHSISESGNINPAEFDLIVVGSPINGWRPTQKVTDFLNNLKTDSLKNVRAAAFDTRVKLFIHGDAAKKIANALKKAGAEIISEPKGFFVKGTEGPLFDSEINNARKWAENLKA